ncbi:MAG: ATP-dependent 6-phosphofructokinase [Phycisphaeraceae bacterium]
MPKSVRRVGVLTGGGDCPGLNAVIRAVVKSAIHRYELEVWGIEDGFQGLIENRMHLLDWSAASNILTLGGTILGSNNKCDPTRWAVRKGKGEVEFQDVTDRCIDHIHARGLEALIVIGGDGTMTVASKFVQRGINCIGVPKTIDNDLWGTDITFGFESAVAVGTDALDRIHTTAASHHRVMIVELMGRNAGWIALHAGLASGADVVLIPEIPYDIDKVCEYVAWRSQRGKRFSLIAASEGAKAVGGQQVVAKIDPTSPDPVRLGGIAAVLAKQIEDKTGIETRFTVLGHVQRGGTPVAADRVLATQFGHAAVQKLSQGAEARLVVKKGCTITDCDLTECAGKQRLIDPGHPLIEAARDVGTSFGE